MCECASKNHFSFITCCLKIIHWSEGQFAAYVCFKSETSIVIHATCFKRWSYTTSARPKQTLGKRKVTLELLTAVWCWATFLLCRVCMCVCVFVCYSVVNLQRKGPFLPQTNAQMSIVMCVNNTLANLDALCSTAEYEVDLTLCIPFPEIDGVCLSFTQEK